MPATGVTFACMPLVDIVTSALSDKTIFPMRFNFNPGMKVNLFKLPSTNTSDWAYVAPKPAAGGTAPSSTGPAPRTLWPRKSANRVSFGAATISTPPLNWN